MTAPPLPVAKGEEILSLLPGMANRHGLVAGATGTGKTTTLRVMTEALSRAGVPVFLADVKGDLSGLALPGTPNSKMEERAARLGLGAIQQPASSVWGRFSKLGVDSATVAAGPFEYAGVPVCFWDLLGEQGHPLRATISEIGPVLLSRILDLNAVQEGVLTLAFRVADDEGLLLLDLKDLRAILQNVAERASELQKSLANVTPASVGAIQRQVLALEQQGGDQFFGEPALDLRDLLSLDPQGNGIVHLLAADKLLHAPRLYSSFLLWLLSELYEQLPEVGDPEKPRLVFFFDEAHLLFRDAPGPLLEQVEKVVRLVRSKGVGVFFVTQNPLDIPDSVLGQLGNRVQHALRAFTPRDQKVVRAAAKTFRKNPKVDTEVAITELAVGEALVSFLDAAGIPSPVERATIFPPTSRLEALSSVERDKAKAVSQWAVKYGQTVDRESAYELLRDRTLGRVTDPEDAPEPQGRAPESRSEVADTLSAMAKSVARSAGTQIGRELVRGVLGGLFGGRRR